MFKSILLPTDGSALSEQAVKVGLELAKEVHGDVVGLYVTKPYHIIAMEPSMITETEGEYEQDTKAQAAKYLSVIERAAKDAGVPFKNVTRSGDYPYEQIINVAREEHCDTICMATHGRHGLDALVHGSQTQKVLTHTKIPVVVVR